jgi:hypothetical protein
VVPGAAAAVAVVAAASFAVASQQDGPTGPRVMRWVGVEETSTQMAHPRAGDSWTIYRKLYEEVDGRQGRKVGDASSRCSAVTVSQEGYIEQCQGVLRTADGALAMQSMQDRFGPGPYRGVTGVDGGSGVYRGASGEVHMTRYPHRTVYEVSLDR